MELGAGDADQDQNKDGSTILASADTTDAPTQPTWNPFDDDNFSNLTVDKFKTEAKKPTGTVMNTTVFGTRKCVVFLIGCKLNSFFFFSDLPLKIEPSSSEELIPGLQAVSVDNTPQDAGMSFPLSLHNLSLLVHGTKSIKHQTFHSQIISY